MASASVQLRRDASATRARILLAAKQAFSSQGYARAGLRDIAALAQVDSALVGRYFGSKAGLFEAALLDGMAGHPDRSILSLGKAGFGRQLAQLMMRAEFDILFPLAMMLSDDAEARRIGDKVTREIIMPPMIAWLGAPDAETRAESLFILTQGLSLRVRQTRRPDGMPAIDAGTLDWFTETVQSIVDRSMDGAAARENGCP